MHFLASFEAQNCNVFGRVTNLFSPISVLQINVSNKIKFSSAYCHIGRWSHMKAR